MDNSETLVSIIMPAYNAAEYIEESITSVLSQSFTNLELFVVNDHSTDETIKIVKRIANKDKRLILTENKGKGVSAARNTGLLAAKRKYISFLNADDTYFPGALQARVETLDNNSELALAHSDVEFVDPKGRPLGLSVAHKRTLSFLDMTDNLTHLNSILGKREVIKRAKFDEALTNGEDWSFLSTILRSGVESAYVHNAGATYRLHEKSTVTNDMEKYETQIAKVINSNFSSSTAKNIAKAYADGLDNSMLSELLIDRLFNRFIWSLFNFDFDEADRILNSQLKPDWFNKKSESFFTNKLRMSALRNFFVHVDDLQSLPRSATGPIYRYLEKINLGEQHITFIKSFNDTFGCKLTSELKTEDEDLKYASISAPEISHLVYQRNDHASVDETRLIHDLFKHKPGMTMIDVGAHFGGSAHKFALKGWDIHCFEPDPKNRVKLINKLGEMPNVRIDTRAISDSEQTNVSFFSSEESTGISGLLAFRETHEEVAQVDITTLTKVFANRNITHVDFLKIDVEGHDFGVLKGVPWDSIRPDVIECEFEDLKTNHLGHVWTDICEFLRAKDYTVYVSEWHPIIRYGISHDWHCLKEYPCQLSHKDAWGNLLAFKKRPNQKDLYEVLMKNIKKRSA